MAQRGSRAISEMGPPAGEERTWRGDGRRPLMETQTRHRPA